MTVRVRDEEDLDDGGTASRAVAEHEVDTERVGHLVVAGLTEHPDLDRVAVAI